MRTRNDSAISVERMSKRYRIGSAQHRADTLVEAAKSVVTAPLRNFRHLRSLDTSRHSGASDDLLWALRDVSFEVKRGELLGVIGRNGAGKSTLLRAWTGLTAPAAGSVTVGGQDPASLRPAELIRHVALVPQEPAELLYAETVAAECSAADRDSDLSPGSCARLLEQLVPGLDPDRHPRDLSEGQRLGLVLAIQLVGDPPVLLLDEPTRGLDYTAKRRLTALLRQLAAQGRAIVLATHDVELAAAVATRTVVLADGEIVVDGPTQEVVVGSPAFAPQVAKILAPLPWLTVGQVSTSLQDAS